MINWVNRFNNNEEFPEFVKIKILRTKFDIRKFCFIKVGIINSAISYKFWLVPQKILQHKLCTCTNRYTLTHIPTCLTWIIAQPQAWYAQQNNWALVDANTITSLQNHKQGQQSIIVFGHLISSVPIFLIMVFTM